MPDEVTFIDLACLLHITPDTTMDNFGSAINASVFDAANLAGSLKQKSLIDFSSMYPGPNRILITDIGKQLLTEANAKSAEPFDNLDQELLAQISGGKRMPLELQNTLNIRPKDLALRLFKLNKQGFLTYELKSGGVDLLLTETGFLKAKPQQSQQPPQAQQDQAQPPSQISFQSSSKMYVPPDQLPKIQPTKESEAAAMKDNITPPPLEERSGNTLLYAIVIILLVVLAVVYLNYTNAVKIPGI